ncbi:MAG: NADH-quinone oxidoreductase subunit NuoE [Rhodospirillales bacterium]|nr:NADH-quinone oxidoreductase subunit NuoE [Rhodospirillales bacterium]
MSQTTYRAPESGEFAFDAENEALAQRIIARYPEGRHRSAVIPLLDIAQRQNGGWLSKEAVEFVAGRLGMAPIRVHEVASFYSMFNKNPVGKYLLQVCRTTPCWLRGSDSLTQTIKEICGIEIGDTSEDGLFTLIEVECLGACCNAPMVQINDDYYEDLTAKSLDKILDNLKNGRVVEKGSQTGRIASARQDGPHILVDFDPNPVSSGILRGDAVDEEAPGPGSAPTPDPSLEEKADAAGKRPAGLDRPRNGKADALIKIKGIGPANEAALAKLGIFHFDQIASWSPEEATWVGTFLAFPGRIEHEEWIQQAKTLAGRKA